MNKIKLTYRDYKIYKECLFDSCVPCSYGRKLKCKVITQFNLNKKIKLEKNSKARKILNKEV